MLVNVLASLSSEHGIKGFVMFTLYWCFRNLSVFLTKNLMERNDRWLM
jgi:hypothetical protein